MSGTRNSSAGVQDRIDFLRSFSYNPTIGQFTSLDSFVGDDANPLSLNKYLYTNGDPINGIDPSGLSDVAVMAFYGMFTASVGGNPRVPVIARRPGWFPTSVAGLEARLRAIKADLQKKFPALFRVMGFDALFDNLISAAKSQVKSVVIDPTLDPGKAHYDQATDTMYVDPAGVGGVDIRVLIHETVHALDVSKGSWYLTPTGSSSRAAEALGHGAEYILNLYLELVQMHVRLERDPKTIALKNFEGTWNSFWNDISSGNYDQFTYPGRYWIFWQTNYLTTLNKADLADIAKKLGLEVNKDLIAPLFPPVP